MKRRSVGASLLTVCMTAGMMMPISAHAATHDAREDASSNVATIQMGKVLTANHKGKFPSTLKSVNYELKAVKGFDNANEDASESGKSIAASALPMPEESDTKDHQVTVNGSSATVTVGNFSSENNDTDVQRTRVTPVQIAFDKAGYYVYQVTETGSNPANVPGVTYDDHSYFVVVYVANKTDAAGNTVDGVYVHNITSYRNEAGSDKYQPDLSDISRVTDNDGASASENTEKNLAKVGSSDSEHPDTLDAYRFWNSANVQDLVLTNNVMGNLGDRSKKFEFQIALSGLEANTVYTLNEPAAHTNSMTSEGAELVRATVGTIQDQHIVSDESGKAEVTVRLQDDEHLVINGLPVSAKYQIIEKESDHIASFRVDSSSDSPVIAKTNAANTESNTSLQTGNEQVDVEDGTITVNYINERNFAIVTGVPEATGPIALLAIVIAGLLGARRKKYE